MDEQLKEKTLERQVEEIVGEFYDPKFPFHNFDHALSARDEGEKIIEFCKQQKIQINELVVRLALLFHDAGYHENYEGKGFKTKEEYAASLAGETLSKLKVAEEIIKQVESAILATHPQKSFDSPETQAVRAADLAGLALNYNIFLQNSKKLWEEDKILSDKKVSWEEWKGKAIKLIESYLSKEIPLIKDYKDQEGRTLFDKARANLERLREQKQPEITIPEIIAIINLQEGIFLQPFPSSGLGFYGECRGEILKIEKNPEERTLLIIGDNLAFCEFDPEISVKKNLDILFS